ncbi:Proto-Oncogene Tyrosine-Protein Kinase Receptor Ret [Manis pentadactyla]|nr:Proto-Oncogene Tyrosine-Protein Kinase Receptor Ret [Manis pentadactyla]
MEHIQVRSHGCGKTSEELEFSLLLAKVLTIQLCLLYPGGLQTALMMTLPLGTLTSRDLKPTKPCGKSI